MAKTALVGLAAWVAMAGGAAPRGAVAEDSMVQVNLTPIHDTYATHNDKTVKGFEPTLRVGIEPQECFPDGWDPCPEDDLVCCDTPDTYNYCAPEGACATTSPAWQWHRKFYSYIRFDLAEIPDGKIVSASLRLQEMGKVEEMGGPVKVVVTELKKIGLPDPICEWDEATLNDSNGTTWNSLPQNLSLSGDGVWAFDVTKAVLDWLEGNPDVIGTPIQPNCGFYLYDPDYGNLLNPVQRWVLFSSKEGGFPPQLSVTVAKDLDGDGWYADCNEEDPEIHPEAVEKCDDVDQDCDGSKDEEDCDGQDNDCDGLIDEEDWDLPLCVEGTICLGGKCVTTCKDECSGPYDKKCEKNADGLWEEWYCKNADKDPCLDWYMWEKCEAPNINCNYGSCSSNCVDVCEPEQKGTTWCHEDSLGHWSLAGCEDYDGDGCLEPGAFDPCPPGAFCHDAKCWPGCQEKCDILDQGSCLDVCVPDEARCAKHGDGFYYLEQCKQDEESGCWIWQDQGACTDPAAKHCKATEKESPVPADFCQAKAWCDNWYMCFPEHIGLELCITDSVGNWHVSKCGDTDGDGCLLWEIIKSCEYGGGCVDAQCTPGCSFRCDDFLALECVGDAAARACLDPNQDGCLEWVELDTCDPAAEACKDGLCLPVAPACEDECESGATKCQADEDGTEFEFSCVTDQDADACLEWGNLKACVYGCDDAGLACNLDMPIPEGFVEGAAEEDVADVVTPADVLPAEPVEEVVTPPPDIPALDSAGTDEADEDAAADGPGPVPTDTGGVTVEPIPSEKPAAGCSCRTAPMPATPGAGTAVLLLAAGLLFLAVRRRGDGQAG